VVTCEYIGTFFGKGNGRRRGGGGNHE
jgi:hypothetical protein